MTSVYPDPSVVLTETLAWARENSFPVLAPTGWKQVSQDAHGLFWAMRPERLTQNADGTIRQGLADMWLTDNGWTVADFTAALRELESHEVIAWREGKGKYTDGRPCHAYYIRFLGLETAFRHRYQERTTRAAADPECGDIVDGYMVSMTRAARIRRERLIARFHATCVYCKRVGTATHGPDGRHWQGDHVWAKSQGGPSGKTNIVLACQSCNAKKHQMSAAEFLAKLEDQRAAGNG